ncbi:uncharacterized protein LOC135681303 [Rhopilema esculentum]|uniref:uncharacterized protein LOC135681303 n=1 Tax=Rhopilema esculentum TaxID=499914 RepID=UPI0031D19938
MRLSLVAITSRSPLSEVAIPVSSPRGHKIPIWHPVGLVCLMGRGDSLALVGNPPSDGVTKKIPVGNLLQRTTSFMSEMNQNSDLDNSVKETGTDGEGLSLGRCPMEEQRGPGRHPTTARTGWSKSMNVAVMECYFLSKPVNDDGKPVRGYRRRMHNIWRERHSFNLTEQRLCDQARMIRKNGWLTHVELEEIKRRVTTEEEGVIDDSSVGEETVINEIPVTEPEIEPVVTFLERSERSEANTKMIEEIIEIMKEGNISQSRSLKKADRKSVNEAVKEVNDALISIRTENITDTNKLISAVALYVARKLGIGKPKIENKTREPWWKRRISESINELRKHINILEREKRGEVSKKGKYHELSKKYNITRKGISTVIEELKQRMQAKAFKLRRYEQRTRQYQINRMFQYDQKKVYQQLQGKDKRENTTPDADESRKFWSNIWDNETQHNKKAKWLEELKNNKPNLSQNDIEITTRMVNQQAKKIPN